MWKTPLPNLAKVDGDTTDTRLYLFNFTERTFRSRAFYDSHIRLTMGFAVGVRFRGQKYGPTCHQRDRADVTEFVTLVRLSSLGQHVGVLPLAGYKRRKSALTANHIEGFRMLMYPRSFLNSLIYLKSEQGKPFLSNHSTV